MSDLLRPALYQAWHGIDNVRRQSSEATETWDVVGPVCESADFLAKGRLLNVAPGDLLVVYSCGAYGMGLASNYNSRPRPAEVLVEDDTFRVVRRRETVTDLLRHEVPEP
jgi:diaminopimelate decarboxylase